MKSMTAFFLSSAMALAADRFDHTVRNDFFAGMMGDSQALDRAMRTAAETIAANPKHAEAMVWHGAGLYFQGGSAMAKGDRAKGMEFIMKGLAEMDRAVEIEPENPGVRIPRGSSLIASVRLMNSANPMVGMLTQKAIGDFTAVYEMQKDHLDKLGTHPLGELLQGLADMHSRSGDKDRAAEFYGMIGAKLPGTEYAKRASAWLQTRETLPASKSQCVGCHVK